MIKIENDKAVIITIEVNGEEKTFTVFVNGENVFVVLPAATNLLHMVGGIAVVFSLGTDAEMVAEELRASEVAVFDGWVAQQKEEEIDNQGLSDLLGDIKGI